jgi:uncharacterized protein YgfB (UPF0149 family)
LAGTYQALVELLDRAHCAAAPAELHGTLCGLLTNPGQTGEGPWLEALLVALAGSAGLREQELDPVLRALREWTLASLEDPELGFRVLLPGDGRPLRERVQALGQWCEGFLYGLGAGAPGLETRLSADAREILREIGELAQVDAELEGDEEQEQAYGELVEFLRIGALALYQELSPRAAKSRVAGTA